MAVAPAALSTSTINWRDPETTIPRGRLQADAKTYFYGGLEARDNPSGLLGPDGQPLCGLSVNLAGLTQDGPEPDPAQAVTGVSSPPTGYVNPLRVAPNGAGLWFDSSAVADYYLPRTLTTVFPGVNVAAPSGDRDLGTEMSLCVKNTTTSKATVVRLLTVTNAQIAFPPPSAGGGQKVGFDVQLPSYSVPIPGGTTATTVNATPNGNGFASVTCAQIMGCNDARSWVSYYVDVDRGYHVHVCGASENAAVEASFTINLGNWDLLPGGTYTMYAQPKLHPTIEGVGTYTVSPGILTLSLQLIAPPPGVTFKETPTC